MSTFGHQPTQREKFALSREERHTQWPGLSTLSRTGNSKGVYKRNGEYIAVPFSTQTKSYAALERGGSSGKMTR
eukprot:scaffold163534_cov35-Tisochrysis_lutea.AAC.1